LEESGHGLIEASSIICLEGLRKTTKPSASKARVPSSRWTGLWSISLANTRSRVQIHLLGDRDSSLSIMTRLRGGRPGFNSWQGQEIRLFSIASRPALGPTQTPIQWAPGVLSLGVKPPGREADHSSPSSAGVKNGEAICPLPIHLHGVGLDDIIKYPFYLCLFQIQMYSVTGIHALEVYPGLLPSL
jgi:hypothetical protein